MKKKILFIMPSMHIGGAERSLLGLLNSFDYERYDVYLFLYRHEGEYLHLIPDRVNLLPSIPKYSYFDVPIKRILFSPNWRFGVARIISKAVKRIHCLFKGDKPGIWMSMQYTSRFLQPLLPPIPGEYDAGIMYLGVPDVLLNKVKAVRKIAWNHTDYEILGPDKNYDLKIYAKINYIVSVSTRSTAQLLKIYPQLSDKAVTIRNILNKDLILIQADEQIAETFSGQFKLVSVGRFSQAKNFDNIPDICKRIREKGLDIKWYLVGYGGDEPLIRQRIDEARMSQNVIIVGKKENPYPYIKACDLYVQPSRYEGKCVSVMEAQILGKPVVITDYPTSESQLEDGVDGLIVPLDNEKCAKSISCLLRNPEKMKHLSNNCKLKDYTCLDDIKLLYNILV